MTAVYACCMFFFLVCFSSLFFLVLFCFAGFLLVSCLFLFMFLFCGSTWVGASLSGLKLRAGDGVSLLGVINQIFCLFIMPIVRDNWGWWIFSLFPIEILQDSSTIFVSTFRSVQLLLILSLFSFVPLLDFPGVLPFSQMDIFC